MNYKNILLFALSFFVFQANAQEAAKSTLRIGVSADYEPVAFIKDNKIMGYDVDVVNSICKEQGLTCEIINQPWDTLISGLRFKKFDVIMGGISASESRAKKMDFSKHISVEKSVLLVRNDGIIEKTCNTDCVDLIDLDKLLEDEAAQATLKKLKSAFESVVIGSQKKTIFDRIIMSLFPGHKIKDFELRETLLDALKKGEVNVIILGVVEAKQFIKKNKDFSVLPVNLFGGGLEGSSLGFQKGNVSLKNKFDEGITQLIKSGELKKISEKWYGEDVSPSK